MTDYSDTLSSRSLYHQIASLLLYQSIFDNEVGGAFLHLLQTLNDGHGKLQVKGLTSADCLQAYGLWFRSLATRNQSWQDFIVTQILVNANPFSDRVQTTAIEGLPTALIEAAKHDLKILQSLYQCTSEHISNWIKTASQTSLILLPWDIENSRDNFLHQSYDWSENLAELAGHYRQYGTGLFSEYQAFSWQQGKLWGIAHHDSIELSELVGYEAQKAALIQNTECLLSGYPALNVLLYGSRGSGKSSLVKSLLQKFSGRGLRLVEVTKSDLKDLPLIIGQLRNSPQKFILFVDDLSFEEDDDAFKSLKVVLEGSMTAKAKNVVVYATSNRRHLIREFFNDRPHPSESDEVHAWDTLQEKLSFSDRFGLTLTFEPANQETYLQIVRHLAQQSKIIISQEELEFRARQWATRHNGRSGRTARQFVDYLQGELGLVYS
jgi:predicted AAA+ superfamily ATPase